MSDVPRSAPPVGPPAAPRSACPPDHETGRFAGKRCDTRTVPQEGATFSGELQSQVMSALWRLQRATVADVREALPPTDRGAYTTVQTVLNRLAERGLVDRRREGRQFVYAPRLTEAEHLSGSVRAILDRATPEARKAVMSELVGSLADTVEPRRRGARRTA